MHSFWLKYRRSFTMLVVCCNIWLEANKVSKCVQWTWLWYICLITLVPVLNLVWSKIWELHKYCHWTCPNAILHNEPETSDLKFLKFFCAKLCAPVSIDVCRIYKKFSQRSWGCLRAAITRYRALSGMWLCSGHSEVVRRLWDGFLWACVALNKPLSRLRWKCVDKCDQW